MRASIRCCALIFAAACVLQAPAVGEDTISADRPGVGTPPSLGPPLRFQMEIGFSYDHYREAGTTTDAYSWNQSLFRFGLFAFAEIRVAAYYVKTSSVNAGGTWSVSGFGPLSLGTKVALGKEKGLRPQAALMANVLLPKTGLEAYRVKHAAPSLLLLFQNSLTKALFLGYNVGLLWNGESPSPSTFYAINLSLNLSKKLQCFAENFGTFNPDGNAFFVDGGLAYLLTPRIQLDVAGGISTNRGQKHAQLAGGFSWLMF